MTIQTIISWATVALLAIATQAQAAPDETTLGKNAGYPKGSVQNVNSEANKIGSFSAMDEIIPSRKVARAGDVWALGTGELPAVQYSFKGGTYTLEDYLNRRRVTSLLVMKDGKILFERYQYDRKPEQRFISYSMAKSITALLIGIAHEKGLIESLDAKAEVYAPELKGSAYGETSIRNLLRMSSGIRWEENYGGRDDVSDLWGALFRVYRGGNPTDVLTRRRPIDSPPGSKFKYSSGETQVLCHVLHGATKRKVAEITEDWLWKPLGAQADAAWLVGWQGIEYCAGGFNATTRDYARLGQLLAQDGARDGKQIIPKEFLFDATDQARQPTGFKLNEAGPRFGYGYQFWLGGVGGKSFAMLGIHGQTMWVIPSAQVVIVQTAAWANASEPAESGLELSAALNAILLSLGVDPAR